MTSSTRPTRDQLLMRTAMLWAERSTCSRAQVGVIISREGRTLTTGYNGAPSGMEHCNHDCNCESQSSIKAKPVFNSDHLSWCLSQKPCENVVHAEGNAIAWAARYGVGLMGADLHTTRVPCLNCAGLIINAGISRVLWAEEHRDMSGIKRLRLAGVGVVQFDHATSSGIYRTMMGGLDG